jgi:glyoxylase-like metal-dependent hydrolase (beta-lactamase superfamily II)
MRVAAVVRSILLVLVVVSGVLASAEPYHLIPGQVPMDKGPDGNTIVLDAPKGLIVFDTGRHPEHAQAILDDAKARHRPIAAIVNSHWHLDHTTGNWDIRQAYPSVDVYASNALEGALATFLKNSRAQTDAALADPRTPSAQRDQLLRGRAVIDHPERIRPNHVISRSGPMSIAGRRLDVHLAKFAATEGDVWIYDPGTRTAIVGDLVVDIVPFMDTACPDGWSSALRELAETPFKTLIPGHGPVMTRTDFGAWRRAYDNFVKCGHSDADKKSCVDGWERDAARFIDDEHRKYVRAAADYYLSTRLRSSPEEQQRYCKPLKAS